MDIKAYIESGILEAYILGSLTEQEAIRVQADIAAYPDLAAELKAIENAMLQYAQSNATEPPANLREKIWDAISTGTSANAGTADAQQHKTKIIPLQPDYRKSTRWRFAALAACLAGSIVLNVALWNQSRDNRQTAQALNYQLDKIQTQQNQMSRLLQSYSKTTTMMADTGMQTVVMHTMQPGHPMAATLYWSKTRGEAYVSMSALPAPPQGMQYQLWVIQGGKPVSMGMLPSNMANTPDIEKIAMQVTSGDAFAISLEKEGGNPVPTTVYVLGRV